MQARLQDARASHDRFADHLEKRGSVFLEEGTAELNAPLSQRNGCDNARRVAPWACGRWTEGTTRGCLLQHMTVVGRFRGEQRPVSWDLSGWGRKEAAGASPGSLAPFASNILVSHSYQKKVPLNRQPPARVGRIMCWMSHWNFVCNI